MALRVRDGLPRPSRGLRVEALDGECGAEFDRLEESVTARFRAHGTRTAAHLRWRYLRHTETPHRILCARRRGELRGFAVFREERADVVVLADLYTVEDPHVARMLVRALVATARRNGATSLWGEAPDDSPGGALLGKLGFAPREAGPGIVVYAPGASRDALQDAASWWVMYGDRDV